MLSQVADSVNSEYPSQRVWFINPNPSFGGHRFCEVDNGIEVTELDWSCDDTWASLSGMSDNSMPETESAQDAENEETNAMSAGNTTALPNPTTCAAALDGDNDWYDQMMCEITMAVELPPVVTNDATLPDNATSVLKRGVGDFGEW